MREALACFTLLVFLLLPTRAQTSKAGCSENGKYENHNQVDPKPLRVLVLQGMVIAADGVTIPLACLTLFTEAGDKVVAQVVADGDGHYKFKELPSGVYRLVVRDPQNVLCVANAKIHIPNWFGKLWITDKQVSVIMRASGYDTCSYADYSRR